MFEITSDKKWMQLRIYINSVLHLHLNLYDFICVHTWTSSNSEFYIQYNWKDGASITTGYSDVEKWKKVLAILDVELTVKG